MNGIDQGGMSGLGQAPQETATLADSLAKAALGISGYPVAAISVNGQLLSVVNKGIPIGNLERMAISSLCRRIVDRGSPWFIGDLWDEPALPAGVANVGASLRALAAWPLSVGEGEVGCLAVFDVIPRFTAPETLEALGELADAASISLRNEAACVAARAGERLARTVIDEVPDGLLQVSEQGKILQANAAARAVLGLPDACTKGCRLAIDIEDGVRLLDDCADAVANPLNALVGSAHRIPGWDRDGTRRMFEVKVGALSAPQAGLLVVLRDVSQLDEARQLLELHALIVEKTESSVLILDPQLSIDWCNSGFERLSGFSLEELQQTSVERFFGGDQVQQAAAFGRLALSGEAFREEFNWRDRSGQSFTISLEAHPIFDGAGMLSRIVALGFDVTDQRRRSKRKSDFVSMVSHELRAPLTVIRGTLDALAAGMLGEIDGYGRDILDLGQRNCQRLAGLIEDLLDINQIETGVMKMSIGEVSMSMLMRDAIGSLQGIAREAEVDLRVGAVAEPGKVYGDPKRVTQVLVNLLSNAIKFSPPGKPVEVSSRVLGNSLRVSVADQGAGIPNDFKPRLFELFSRDPAVAASGKEGFGLGLCISKGLVENMGGEIGFDSEQGIGSTFYFDLPLAPTATRDTMDPVKREDLTT